MSQAERSPRREQPALRPLSIPSRPVNHRRAAVRRSSPLAGPAFGPDSVIYEDASEVSYSPPPSAYRQQWSNQPHFPIRRRPRASPMSRFFRPNEAQFAYSMMTGTSTAASPPPSLPALPALPTLEYSAVKPQPAKVLQRTRSMPDAPRRPRNPRADPTSPYIPSNLRGRPRHRKQNANLYMLGMVKRMTHVKPSLPGRKLLRSKSAPSTFRSFMRPVVTPRISFAPLAGDATCEPGTPVVEESDHFQRQRARRSLSQSSNSSFVLVAGRVGYASDDSEDDKTEENAIGWHHNSKKTKLGSIWKWLRKVVIGRSQGLFMA